MGGSVPHALVRVANQAIGLRILEFPLPSLDAANARFAAAALEALDAQSEPAENFIKRDRAWRWEGRLGW